MTEAITNPEVRKALRALLDYVEPDERRDYEENPNCHHIYVHIEVLRKALETPIMRHNEVEIMMKWSELFPSGRHIFYEGDDPKAFAKEIKETFGFDPGEDNPNWNVECGYSFHCPAHHLDEIYGGDKYPMGS